MFLQSTTIRLPSTTSLLTILKEERITHLEGKTGGIGLVSSVLLLGVSYMTLFPDEDFENGRLPIFLYCTAAYVGEAKLRDVSVLWL